MVDEEKAVFEDESTDFYDEFKDRMRQEPLKSVLSQQAQASKPTSGIVTVIIGILLATLVLWYVIGKYFLEQETSSEVAPPVISKNIDPVKVKPENVGGMEIAGRDKSVYNRMNQSSSSAPERIIARREVPSEVKVTEKVEVKATIDSPIVEKNKEEKDAELSLPMVIEETVAVKETVVEAKPVRNEESKKIVMAPALKEKVEVKVEEKAEVITVKPVYQVKPEPKVAPVAKDGWKVQILSSRDKAGVEKTWQTLKSKHSDLLANVTHEIVTADLGDRGVFYRLRVGGYPDRAVADDLCKKLKSKKVDCFVVK